LQDLLFFSIGLYCLVKCSYTGLSFLYIQDTPYRALLRYMPVNSFDWL